LNAQTWTSKQLELNGAKQAPTKAKDDETADEHANFAENDNFTQKT
jgi:hypothetical protein